MLTKIPNSGIYDGFVMWKGCYIMDNVRPASRSVNISDEVLCRVAALAAQDIEGVASLYAARSLQNPAAQPVTIQNLGGAISVNASILVKPEARAVSVASAVQKAIKQGIQDMTGVTAVHVHVDVNGMEEEA